MCLNVKSFDNHMKSFEINIKNIFFIFSLLLLVVKTLLSHKIINSGYCACFSSFLTLYRMSKNAKIFERQFLK